MKKLSLYILTLAGLLMSSCGSDDYVSWADPQSYSENAVTIPGYQASEVGAVNLAKVEDDSVAIYNLSEAALPEDYILGNSRIVLTAKDAKEATVETVATTVNGKAAKADLQTLIEKAFGKAPTARTFEGQVYTNAIKDGQSVLVDAGKVNVTVTPNAPFVSAGYYVVGGTLDWAASAKDKTQKFTHSETNVYDDPTFTITIPAAASGDTWFALASEEACNAITEKNDWSQLFGTTVGNGKNGFNQNEKFATRSELSDDGSFCVPASTGAKYIKITINVFENTYDIVPMNYQEFMYMAGHANDWKQIDYLRSANFDGKYTGFMYLDQDGFKFCSKADWSGTNYGENFSTDGGAGNITMKEADGYYKVDVDLTTNKLALTAIKTIGVIGDATEGGWDSDQDMTYNKTSRAWEISNLKLKDGTIKFRANDGWDINWGGAAKALTQGGDNLKVTAGTYSIKLYAWCDGKAYCEITKK